MNLKWSDFFISIFLFILITIYDIMYAPFCKKVKYDWSRKKRIIFRNIIYSGLVIFDIAVVLLTINGTSENLEKKILFYGCLALGILLIINSLTALAKRTTLYSVGYVVEYVLRFIAVAILLGVQFFIYNGIHILYSLVVMYFISRQGMRLLEGDVLAFISEDIMVY